MCRFLCKPMFSTPLDKYKEHNCWRGKSIFSFIRNHQASAVNEGSHHSTAFPAFGCSEFSPFSEVWSNFNITVFMCCSAWEYISHNLKKPGSLLVTVPSLEDSLSGLQVCQPTLQHFYCQNFSPFFFS